MQAISANYRELVVGHRSGETLVLSGQRRGEVIRRISEDNGRTWTETGTLALQEHRGDRDLHWHHPTYCLDPEHGLLIEFTTQYER